MARP
ncbi:hypothetical protein CICLE_v100270092mg, partial [Citrus x clementina]|jgi:hypothetical protein